MEKSISMKPKTWQDGVKELASVIEAPDFIGWASEPERIAAAAQSLPNVSGDTANVPDQARALEVPVVGGAGGPRAMAARQRRVGRRPH